ncbi:protein FAM110C [Sphaeramia orbicularis]|uniref:protein FAM110C n=1 Tax=Sphaeramia orbicularis TaxID=375764 RepID=UPI00117C285B|nr:protein FAM110C [Sphaeramia orbicularis]
METVSDTNKILEKGPEYLRKQMETGTKGGMSAVERLAASKVKYVKSQKVVNSTQEPAISLGSASVSSTGSSNRSSNCGRKVFSPSKKSAEATGGGESSSPGQVRRSSSKKRPDSLLIYRQKCELLKGSGYRRRHHINRKQQQKSSMKNDSLPEAEKECESKGHEEKITTPEGDAKECKVNVVVSQPEQEKNGEAKQHTPENSDPETNVTADHGNKSQGLLAVPEFQRTGKGVSRSHSDISSRYSKNFADFDAFFKYCGLDGEVVESLGKENFSARSDDLTKHIRSISISTSDDCFSRNSDESDGLQEEELQKKIRQGTSVIERNARIIKWLYSCKNAKDTGKKLRDLH